MHLTINALDRLTGAMIVLANHSELSLQSRLKGVQTTILSGVPAGIDMTAPAPKAWQFGYDMIMVERACANLSVGLRAVAITRSPPRIARSESFVGRPR